MVLNKKTSPEEVASEKIQQSAFSEAELFDYQPLAYEQTITKGASIDPTKKQYYMLLITGGIGLVLVLLALIYIAVSFFPSHDDTSTNPANLSRPQQTPSSEFDVALQSLRSKLDAADPILNNQPFPPVNLDLSVSVEQ